MFVYANISMLLVIANISGRNRKGRTHMPLSFANMGEKLLIKKVGGGQEVRRHLETLGFVAGEPVTVVTSLGGNLIVSVKNARVAISREMAERVSV